MQMITKTDSPLIKLQNYGGRRTGSFNNLILCYSKNKNKAHHGVRSIVVPIHIETENDINDQ